MLSWDPEASFFTPIHPDISILFESLVFGKSDLVFDFNVPTGKRPDENPGNLRKMFDTRCCF